MLKKSFFLASFLLLSCLSTAHAQILIEQGKVKIAATPGQTASGFLSIHNTAASPMSLRAYWEDFVYVPPFDGTKKFTPAGTTDRSLSQWITFIPDKFEIPAFGKQELTYTIHVPKEASGGYYGVLFVEKGGGALEGMAGVEIVTRVGSLFFVETKDHAKAAKISETTMSGREIKSTFTNQGNVILIPKGTYYVIDKQGVIAARGEIRPFYLPPQEKISFKVKLPALKAGLYLAVITFDLEDGKSLVQEIEIKSTDQGTLTLINSTK